ncbi:PspC domain-containing protein [Facklamia miroungae]|uniref:Phage shock protein PspC (Stress-responsive transcriptional regulator) n=1 Tax=Facklamia miroungae TaxID=120956 RepID=A0A1G7RRU7_9LACT|nr:PspC domain-containing protein [Facklamia miroungae]NKZ29299.1 PspC domain-containing protein [Facklamia miroungae]SDG13548.1 Phage shock protein PspC (stress-responsive transcriptional regulator) [Facklamia miroungae]
MKRLTRSSSDRRFLGVCGGLGEYFNIDATLIRLIFLISMFTGGIGVFPYILMALIIPYDYQVKDRPYYREGTKRPTFKSSKVVKDITPNDDDNWSDF